MTGHDEMKYNQPQVRDYGTLLELTADIDVHVTGAVSNLVIAAMSNPIDPARGGSSSGGGVDPLVTGPPPGGKLPFTGFPVMLFAAVGAALAAIGSVIRSSLRRRR
jgi:hypothetical protein